MLYHDFMQALNDGTDAVRRHFRNWQAPDFFLQFNAGFELSGLFDEPPQELPLSSLPLMPPHHTPDNHQPSFLYGTCQGVVVLAAFGHRHLFEGLGPIPCIFPTCLAWNLHIPRMVFVDPVLSLSHELKTGSWTVLTDFINGHHLSPLDGLLPMLETPFPDMTHALSQHLNSELVNALAQVAINARLCVYEALPGSHFCTPAEARMAQAVHADIVGHDMVMEIITAHALGRQVAALGLVAEMAPTEGAKALNRANILENCRYCSDPMLKGLKIAMRDIASQDNPHAAPVMPAATADEALFQDLKRPSGKEPVLKRFLKR